MSQPGWKKWFHPLDPASFGADEPLSAYRAAVARSNVQHGITQRAQTRVNWSCDVGSGEPNGFTIGPNGDSETGWAAINDGFDGWVWAQQFMFTMFDPSYPSGLDMRVSAFVESGNEVQLAARIVPFRYGLFDLGKTPIVAAYGSTTSTTPDEVISIQWFGSSEDTAQLLNLAGFPVLVADADTNYYQPKIYLLRVEVGVFIVGGGSTDLKRTISSVLVREFWP